MHSGRDEASGRSAAGLVSRYFTGTGLLLLLAAAVSLIFGSRPALAGPGHLAAAGRGAEGQAASAGDRGEPGPTGPTGHPTPGECGGSGPCQVGAFAAIGCGSTTTCTAVGSGVDGALAEDWNGSAWSLDSTVNPDSTNLTGAWCTSSTWCIAVGSDSSGMISETHSGSSWSAQSVPLPSGASSGNLTQVSCTSASACTTVGSQYSSTGSQAPLAERWNGTSWSPQTTPLPSGASSAQFEYVWCVTASSCTAVGYDYSAAGQMVPLAELWNGTAWKLQKVPVPSGATSSELNGVSCPTATFCEAVGEYGSSSGEETLAEVRHGTTWTVQSIPNPSGSTYNVLNSVSCTSTAGCMAVGQDQSGSLSEQWNGSSWSVVSVPAPSDANLNYGEDLRDLACASAGSCMAAGSYTDTEDCEVPLAESWNGSAWAVSPTVSPVALSSSYFPSGTVGKSYSSGLSACGGPGPYTWSVTGKLPTGLTLNTSTGVISGKPKYAGTYSFQLTVAVSSTPSNSTTVSTSIQIDSPKTPTAWPLEVAQASPPPSGNTGPVLVNPQVAYVLVGSWWCPLFGSGGPISDPTDTACSGGSGGSSTAQSADIGALWSLVTNDYGSSGYASALSSYYEVQNGTTTYVGAFGPEPTYSNYGTVWAGPLAPGSFTINDSFMQQLASGFGLNATQASNTVFVFLYAPNLLNCNGTGNGATNDGKYVDASVYLEDSSHDCTPGKVYASRDPSYATDFATFAVSHEVDEAVTDPGANPQSWLIPNSSGTWQIADVCQFRNAEGDTSPTSTGYPYFNMTRDGLGTVVASYVSPYGPPYTCGLSSGTGIPPG